MDIRKILSKLVAQVEAAQQDSEGAYPAPDPGCSHCTDGRTPASQNTGLCGYHSALVVLGAESERTRMERHVSDYMGAGL